MNSLEVLYQSQVSPEYFLRYATEQDDQQLVELIAETMPSNGMTLSFERSPSYFNASRTLYNDPQIMVIYHVENPDYILGMMNIGSKDCYINGEARKLRYAADLRIKRHARGKKSLEVFMEYVFNNLSDALIFQNIVLEDNKIARHLMHQHREGFATPYLYDQITTYTISHVKKSKLLDQYTLEPLSYETVEAATQFVAEMNHFYNFIPTYNFRELAETGYDFWRGMRLEDFYLVRNAQQDIVGLFGLWDQKSFKQTKVVKYSTSLKLLRPLYNAYAKVFGHIYLPAEGECFDYLMLHSALCRPDDLNAYEYLLYQAHVKTKSKAKSSFCVTLADNDPRTAIARSCRAYTMRAIHGFHSYGASPESQFDRERISFFETGRI